MRIAHISDPHLSSRFYPRHLLRLRTLLEHAIHTKRANHIVITGDLTSDAESRDLKKARALFEEFGLLDTKKLTIIPGNHDLYGGPHMVEDLMSFPARCRTCDYDKQLAEFLSFFPELFEDIKRASDTYFPFAKRIGNSPSIALIGIDSNARHSPIRNPVGSNGELSEEEYDQLNSLLLAPEVKNASHRVLLMHHHLFRVQEEHQFRHRLNGVATGLFQMIEKQSLKFYGKKRLLKLLEKHHVSHVLHGHVHFTGTYIRSSIQCLNAAGAIQPLTKGPLAYMLIEASKSGVEHELVELQVTELLGIKKAA